MLQVPISIPLWKYSIKFHILGKFVSSLIAFLISTKIVSGGDKPSQSFPPELATLLNETQKLVVASIKQKDQENEQIKEKLDKKITELKEFFGNKEGPKE